MGKGYYLTSVIIVAGSVILYEVGTDNVFSFTGECSGGKGSRKVTRVRSILLGLGVYS